MWHSKVKTFFIPLLILTIFFIGAWISEPKMNLNEKSFITDSLAILHQRVQEMSNIQWTPKKDIPSNKGNFIAGNSYIGLPYSSVKQLQKFIGLDVSIYTFLTAVNNPKSLLYTQNVAKGYPCYLGGEYYGVNCASFYGTVCSSFTAYCYGEIHNYTSSNYKDGIVPGYIKKDNQSIQNLQEGELWWNPGHVALIYAIVRDKSGKVKEVSIAESCGTHVRIKDYTPEKFLNRFQGNGEPDKHAVMYSNIDFGRNYSSEKSEFQRLNEIHPDSIVYNDDICTWFGDKPCVADWDILELNFNPGDYSKLLVFKDDSLVDTYSLQELEGSLRYSHRGPGMYKACLATKNQKSDFTSFEILDTTTDFDQDEVMFAPGAYPEIVYWTNKAGNQLSNPLIVTDNDRANGKMKIDPKPSSNAILRVIYRGIYGRAINRPDYIE